MADVALVEPVAIGPADLRICLFGEIAVVTNGRRIGARELSRRPKQVLEILVAARGRPVAKEQLSDLMWGERPPRHHLVTLESYVSLLRRCIEPGRPPRSSVIETLPRAYRFAFERTWIDFAHFDELVDQATRSPRSVAARLLDDAVRLVQGEFLADEPYAEWAEPLRATYRRHHINALVDCACCHLSIAHPRRAVERASEALVLDAASEVACRAAMAALHLLDERAEALRVFRRFERGLRDELGVKPSPVTIDLAKAIEHDRPIDVPWRFRPVGDELITTQDAGGRPEHRVQLVASPAPAKVGRAVPRGAASVTVLAGRSSDGSVAHPGSVAGTLARAMTGSCVVWLRRDVEPDQTLTIRRERSTALLLAGSWLVAEAYPSVVAVAAPDAPTIAWAFAAHGGDREPLRAHHSSCFGCGADADGGQGRSTTYGRGAVVARWRVHEADSDGSDAVAIEHVWAALSCATEHAAAPCLPRFLGRLAVSRLALPTPSTPAVVIAWARSARARMVHCEAVVVDESGHAYLNAAADWLR